MTLGVTKRTGWYLGLVATLLIIASCGGGGGTGPSVEVSLTGTYQGSFGNDTSNFTTNQSGDSVRGTYTLGSGDSGNFAGTTSPAQVVIGHQATQLKLTGRMTSLRGRGTCDIDTLATSGGASIAGSFRCSDGRRGNMSLSRTSAPPPPAQTLSWNLRVTAVGPKDTRTFQGTVSIPRDGGSGSFSSGGVTIDVNTTRSTFAVSGSGSVVSGGKTCGVSVSGSGPITESATAFSASGSISGICSAPSGTIPLTGSFSATASK